MSSLRIAPETLTYWKDIGQLVGYFLAVPVASFGFLKGIYEIGAGRRQRAEELRWKRANSAKELLDGIHNHELAKYAVHMLDWVDGSAVYTIQGHPEVIAYSEVLKALAMNHGESGNFRTAYIRDCFDWFFYRVDRIEHYIRRGLIEFEDVREVFKVYAREIGIHADVYDEFLGFHEYALAHDFFKRYQAATVAHG